MSEGLNKPWTMIAPLAGREIANISAIDELLPQCINCSAFGNLCTGIMSYIQPGFVKDSNVRELLRSEDIKCNPEVVNISDILERASQELIRRIASYQSS